MSSLTTYSSTFEDADLTTLTWKGEPAWIAREIGQLIGYAGGGRRLVDNIRKDWADELIEGTDYLILTGKDLAAFKSVLELDTDSVSSRTPSLLLLLEPGLHMVLTKTTKPAGKRLRRFLVSEVLPQVARDGRYMPEREVEKGRIVEREKPRKGSASARERRLWEKLRIEDRKLKAKGFRNLIADLEAYGEAAPEVLQTLRVKAAEAETGVDLSGMLPVVAELWLSPTEIAARWEGVTPNRVGRLLTRLEFRGDTDVCKQVMNKAKGHDRTVFSYVYNRAGVRLIDAELEAAGYARGDGEVA